MKQYSTYLLLSLLAVEPSCTNSATTTSPNALASPVGLPDKVQLAANKPVSSLAFPAVFEAAFLSGTTVQQDTATYSCHSEALGQLGSETGKLLAGDPITISDRRAFSRRFPLGSFPVQLALIRFGQDERVGFARVVFDTARVANWQLALLPGQAPLALRDSSFYCYGVDAGMGVFIDSVANRQLAGKGQAAWEQIFMKRTEQPGYTGYLYRFDGHSLATFTTGFGDGCYPTYIGFDAKGKVCRLLTDFRLINW